MADEKAGLSLSEDRVSGRSSDISDRADSTFADGAALFTEEDVYSGDDTPTPGSIVARLTRKQREQRVEWLIQQAHDIYLFGVEKNLGARRLAASCILFSGGNDSTTLAHLMRGMGFVTHAIHANTTIGIEQTREFVRQTCADWKLPLIEKVAPITYRDLVLERGFPGPAMHYKMFQRLKERCLEAARNELVDHPYRERVVFIAGRRRAESERRKAVPLWEIDGSIIWVSPIALWTKQDLNTYRLMHPDIPHNEVTDKIHMSGECLCGAFARPNELDEIGFWFPEVKAEIEQLQRDVAAAGHSAPYDTWGHGSGGSASAMQGRLCTSCVAPLPGQTVMFTAETEDAA